MVDDLVVTGTVEECAARFRAYLDAGLDVVNIMIPPGVTADAPAQIEFLCRLAAAVTDAGVALSP